jgi:hypothetical protein
MITVPVSALSDSDDAGNAITPEVGDMVDLGKAQAEVTAINGENASLCIKAVNGKAVADDSKCEAGEDEQEGDDKPSADPSDIQSASGDHKMRAKLQRAMAKADKESGY